MGLKYNNSAKHRIKIKLYQSLRTTRPHAEAQSTKKRWSEIADWEPIIAGSASAVIQPSEKSSININRKSHTRFPMSPRWTSYVALSPPKGAQNAKRPFSSKIALRLKKVCYKVYSCENCQRQSCRAFIGLTIHAKIIGGERPLLLEISDQCGHVGAKSPIFDLFSLVAPQP